MVGVEQRGLWIQCGYYFNRNHTTDECVCATVHMSMANVWMFFFSLTQTFWYLSPLHKRLQC